jgi:hypothetical protein
LASLDVAEGKMPNGGATELCPAARSLAHGLSLGRLDLAQPSRPRVTLRIHGRSAVNDVQFLVSATHIAIRLSD